MPDQTISSITLSRRDMLRLAQAATLGVLGLTGSACAPGTTAVPTAAAPAAPPPTTSGAVPTANTAPTQVGSATADWDNLVKAAQAEGKVVVSGPPDPDARTKLPDAVKQRFNIDMEYLAGNT